MHIRSYAASDLQQVINLTIETFRPFYEDYVHPPLGDAVFRHQHGQWKQKTLPLPTGQPRCRTTLGSADWLS